MESLMKDLLKKILFFTLLLFLFTGVVELAWEISWRESSHPKTQWILDAIGKTRFNQYDPALLRKDQKIHPVEGDEKIRVKELLKVDINHASVDELLGLPRVGPKMAERILEARKRWGPFKQIENLKVVKGMGPKTREMLKERVKFSGELRVKS